MSLNPTSVPAKQHQNPPNGLNRVHNLDRQTHTNHATGISRIACAARATAPGNIRAQNCSLQMLMQHEHWTNQKHKKLHIANITHQNITQLSIILLTCIKPLIHLPSYSVAEQVRPTTEKGWSTCKAALLSRNIISAICQLILISDPSLPITQT